MFSNGNCSKDILWSSCRFYEVFDLQPIELYGMILILSIYNKPHKDEDRMQTFPLATYSKVPYTDLATNGVTDPVLVRQANLVLNDPYYSRLYARLMETVSHQEAVDQLIYAGCFDDKLEERINHPVNYMSAPYPLIKKQFEQAEIENPGVRKAIIISTGSYDPMHEGHIEALVRARDYLETEGLAKVIAGVMSASHDVYVRRKNPGGIAAQQRIHDNTVFMENSQFNQPVQWVYHDHWESLGIHLSTNFTDVITYISGMVKTYVNDDIDIYYVFGSDNAGFGLAFDHGENGLAKGICVGRPGYELRPQMRKTLEESATLFYTRGTNDMSSTAIRAKRKAQLENSVKSPCLPFAIRDDMKLSGQWMNGVVDNLEERQDVFMTSLTKAFGNSFERIRIIDVAEQLRMTEQFLKDNHPHQRILSGDVYFQGDKQVRGSRLFDISSSQFYGKGAFYANGDPNVDNDTQEYVFVDDDIVSGSFLAEVSKHFNISAAVSMAEIFLEQDFKEIVDVRDFLIGSENGGLMMDAVAPFRAPYLGPFVDLISRVSIPSADVKGFNHDVWLANASFYEGTGLTVEDLPEPARDFFLYLGFKASDEVETICRYYSDWMFS